MNVLFVCSRNKLRSPTAEEVFSAVEGLSVASAGTATDADNALSLDLLEWADIIFAMESVHKKRMQASYGAALRGKRVVVLGIRDKYSYMQPDLIDLLRVRVAPYLRGTA